MTSCEWEDSGFQSFDFNLRGTWETNNPAGSIYTGKLVIDFFDITITGFDETQTPPAPAGDERQLPFKDFTRGFVLTGYSEKTGTDTGNIIIHDRGSWQPHISYKYFTLGSGSQRNEFLLFSFGAAGATRNQLLVKQK